VRFSAPFASDYRFALSNDKEVAANRRAEPSSIGGCHVDRAVVAETLHRRCRLVSGAQPNAVILFQCRYQGLFDARLVQIEHGESHCRHVAIGLRSPGSDEAKHAGGHVQSNNEQGKNRSKYGQVSSCQFRALSFCLSQSTTPRIKSCPN
jgi:hypothetical protein